MCKLGNTLEDKLEIRLSTSTGFATSFLGYMGYMYISNSGGKMYTSPPISRSLHRNLIIAYKGVSPLLSVKKFDI